MNNQKSGEVTPQETILQAHALYKANNYEQALKLYQLIPNKGSATWYNMGNCAYHLGNYMDARLYWKRAERNASHVQRADIRYNIQALDKKVGLQKKETSYAADQGIALILSVPLISMQLFFLVGWFGLWAYVKRWHTKERYIVLYFLIGLNSFLGFAVLYRMLYADSCAKVMITSPASLYTGPNSCYHVVGMLPEATECMVRKTRGDWYQVRSDSLAGWIKKDHCDAV
jgi:tetratricopeptide (TPR) repeat protein